MFSDWIPLTVTGISETAALAAVALVGYLFGRRRNLRRIDSTETERQRQLSRAVSVARQLETVADTLRQDLASHHRGINRFKRLLDTADEEDEKTWELLCREAESILGPTMQLAHQVAQAYDEIRRQSDMLQTFTEGRTDPLTGVGNGRALEQQLAVMLGTAERGAVSFTVALVSFDRESAEASKDEPCTHRLLPELAKVIQSCMREDDFVARYGDDEFVVVLSQTSLPGAGVFCNRLRSRVSEELSATVSCGMAESRVEDESKTLLARADSAFYSARAAGGNRQFVHTGSHIRESNSSVAAAAEVAKSAENSDRRTAEEAKVAEVASSGE